MAKNSYKFNLADWGVWRLGELIDTAETNNFITGTPKLAQVKSMVRRRMPILSKYIYELNEKLDKAHKVNHYTAKMPSIFASKNAELNRTFKIIRTFDTDVSPAQFSMSVHNAIAGLLSVINHDNSVYTVIDSMSGTLETAIIEAISLLNTHKFIKIIYFDESLPVELSESFASIDSPIVLALIIQQGNNIELSCQQSTSDETCENFQSLIEFLNGDIPEYSNNSPRLRWRWTKHG